MVYRVLADALVVVHFCFIVFVLCGGLLVLRRWSLSLLHLPSVAWAVVVELSGGGCPLTPFENRLRYLSGSAGYSGGFIEHYLLPVIYPNGLTRQVQTALALVVMLANVMIYAVVALRRGRTR